LRKSYSKYSDKKEKTRNTLVSAKRPLGTLAGHFVLYGLTPALAATVESMVMDVQYTTLIRFPIIAQRSKGAHYFHRVVGLVVNICQWGQSHHYLLDYCKWDALEQGRKLRQARQ